MKRNWLIAVVLAVLTAGGIGLYVGMHADFSGVTPVAKKEQNEYVCPMHPFIISNSPTTCPICAMDLVKKVAGATMSDQQIRELSHVAVSPNQQIMANLATATVGVQPFSREISCTGIVTYDQERQSTITAWVAGHIDSLLVKSVGAPVRKNRPIAKIFSLSLKNAEEQYILAYNTIRILNSTITYSFPLSSQQALGEAGELLRQLGFREEQFAQLQKAAKPNVRIPILSPLSGVVTEKLVQEGQYVNVGDPLFKVADLSQVWVELEVHEGDFPLFRKGQDVVISSKSYPGRLFRGKVIFIYPFLDPKTRTVKVRVALPNPNLELKPDMFVSAVVSISIPDSLVVPPGSVMDTGKRQLVWVESEPGVFIPREVKTGSRSSAGVQVLAGLEAGEKVAVTGAYLIDSEAQLSRGGEVAAQPLNASELRDELDMSTMKMRPGTDVPRLK
jgi:membrane fusion protein, copper/silver efflux system